MNYLGSIILVYFTLLSSSWALPWHPPISKQTPKSIKTMEQPLDFSGHWRGECGSQPALDLTIKHEANKLRISYGYMEERFIIGEVKEVMATHLNDSEHSTNYLNLDVPNKALIFINSNLFKTSANAAEIFFSKVQMVLDDETLLVKGQFYQTDAGIELVTEDNLSCLYHRVPH